MKHRFTEFENGNVKSFTPDEFIAFAMASYQASKNSA